MLPTFPFLATRCKHAAWQPRLKSGIKINLHADYWSFKQRGYPASSNSMAKVFSTYWVTWRFLDKDKVLKLTPSSPPLQVFSNHPSYGVKLITETIEASEAPDLAMIELRRIFGRDSPARYCADSCTSLSDLSAENLHLVDELYLI